MMEGPRVNVDIGNSKLFKKLNELIVKSVKGNMFDDEDFIVSYFKTYEANKAVFRPRIKKLQVILLLSNFISIRTDGTVLEVKMVEPSADFTQIVFSNRNLNSTLSDAIFSN